MRPSSHPTSDDSALLRHGKNFKGHLQMRRATLLELLRGLARGLHCKQDIRRESGLSWGAVSTGVSELLSRGILRPLPIADSRAEQIGFPLDAHLVMGAELQPHAWQTAIMAADGTLIAQLEFPRTSQPSQLDFLGELEGVVSKAASLANLPNDAIEMLGISLYGAVDSQGERWLQAPRFPNVHNVDFSQWRKAFPTMKRCRLSHDINDKARSIQTHFHDDAQDFVFIHIHEGIGLAICQNGSYLRGSRGFAGELGHIPATKTDKRARLCRCGHRNCLETYCSTMAAEQFAQEKFGKRYGISMTEREWDAIYDYLEPYLLQLCVTAVNAYDPKRLVVGGELLDPMPVYLTERLFPKIKKATWNGAPRHFTIYSMKQCNCPLGAALGLQEDMLNYLASFTE